MTTTVTLPAGAPGLVTVRGGFFEYEPGCWIRAIAVLEVRAHHRAINRPLDQWEEGTELVLAPGRHPDGSRFSKHRVPDVLLAVDRAIANERTPRSLVE